MKLASGAALHSGLDAGDCLCESPMHEPKQQPKIYESPNTSLPFLSRGAHLEKSASLLSPLSLVLTQHTSIWCVSNSSPLNCSQMQKQCRGSCAPSVSVSIVAVAAHCIRDIAQAIGCRGTVLHPLIFPPLSPDLPYSAGLLETAAALAPAGSLHLEAAVSFLEELPRPSILPGGSLHAAVAGTGCRLQESCVRTCA